MAKKTPGIIRKHSPRAIIRALNNAKTKKGANLLKPWAQISKKDTLDSWLKL